MKTVLITGGFGNIGLKVVDELLERGFKVRCLDLKTKNNLKAARKYKKRIEICWGDITDTRVVEDSIKHIDAVIHMAAILPPFSEEIPDMAYRVNVDGTRNIVTALEKYNPRAHFIFASSVSVHGIHLPEHAPGRRINDPFNPFDHYSDHKVECEHMLQQTALHWTVLRISACTDEKARMLDFRNIKGSVQTFLKVNPDCRIEYIHPADVATGMANAIGNPEAIGQKFFLGGGAQCQSSWRELNSIRLEMLGLIKPPAECFGTEGFYTEWLDTDESQRVLKFQNHNLEDYRNELDEMLKWPRILLKPVKPVLNRTLWKFLPSMTGQVEGIRS